MDLQTMAAQRLAMLGYTVTDADLSALRYHIARAVDRIKADCNLPELPEPLLRVVADMAAAAILQERKAVGMLEGFDFEAAIASFKEGDVQITAAAGTTPEQQFDAYLRAMMSPPPGVLAAYRKLRW